MTDNIQEEIEDKIIDCINSGVMGRLIIFKTEKNNFNADLAVERRGKYKEKEIYFQINTKTGPVQDNIFIKDFPQDSFAADKNFNLLFVYFDEVKQKINDYVWLIPSLIFRDIATVEKNDIGQHVLRFQTSLDLKNKDKFSKFIIDSKHLGKFILMGLESGGKFDFKESEFEEKGDVNLENLHEFISEARRNTYAANASVDDNPRLLASCQLEFQKGNYFYRDIYFIGGRKFIGQEIVYQNSKPVWGMNYMGNSLGKLENDFLKEALFKLAAKCRFGQSCDHEKREYRYQDSGRGKTEEFAGTEEIFVKGESIYKLNYQGGLISDKT